MFSRASTFGPFGFKCLPETDSRRPMAPNVAQTARRLIRRRGLRGTGCAGSRRGTRSAGGARSAGDGLFAVNVRRQIALAKRALGKFHTAHRLNGLSALGALMRTTAGICWSEAHMPFLLSLQSEARDKPRSADTVMSCASSTIARMTSKGCSIAVLAHTHCGRTTLYWKCICSPPGRIESQG